MKKKTILITGSTDGIGFETAKSLVQDGHKVLLHGRNQKKLDSTREALSKLREQSNIETYLANLSILGEVKALADKVKKNHLTLDVLVNNAGVYMVPKTESVDGLDVRFVVNTIAPYLLAQELAILLGNQGRIINLSSAAQATVDPNEITKPSKLPHSAVYAKSKLALTMWSRQMAENFNGDGPAVIAVNPASMLGSKMVQSAYGITGGDLKVGADILVRAAVSEEFSDASGKYFDNDIGQFTSPHPDALIPKKTARLTQTIESILTKQY